MGAHDRAVDHRVFIVGIGSQMLENPLPNAGLGPSAEAPVDVLPIAEALRQIAPRNARTVAIQDRLDEQPIVRRRHPDVTLPSGKQLPDAIPLVIAKAIPSHGSAPKWLTPYESKISSRRNL